MKKNYLLISGMLFLILILSSTFVLAAQEIKDNESSDSGIGIDELVLIGSSLLAMGLFILTFIAYKRDGRKRLLYVATAFLLFFIKGILLSIDAFSPQKGVWADPLANFLDFAILDRKSVV